MRVCEDFGVRAWVVIDFTHVGLQVLIALHELEGYSHHERHQHPIYPVYINNNKRVALLTTQQEGI